jgi:hypothetical protein
MAESTLLPLITVDDRLPNRVSAILIVLTPKIIRSQSTSVSPGISSRTESSSSSNQTSRYSCLIKMRFLLFQTLFLAGAGVLAAPTQKADLDQVGVSPTLVLRASSKVPLDRASPEGTRRICIDTLRL